MKVQLFLETCSETKDGIRLKKQERLLHTKKDKLAFKKLGIYFVTGKSYFCITKYGKQKSREES